MSDKYIYYFCIFIAAIMILLFIIILILDSERKKTKYYQYKIKFEEDLGKHTSMLRKQKRVLFKKQMELFFLKILARIKGVKKCN